MKTNEVEKQTLLFYEKEKLIEPCRDDDGYRNYSDKDVKLLMLIKFLRSMEISIDDIRLILNHQLSFQDCLKTQQIHIDQKLKDIQEVNQQLIFIKKRIYL